MVNTLISLVPNDNCRPNDTEYGAISKCVNQMDFHQHFTYQDSLYEDEWTSTSVTVTILNQAFDYST